MNSCEFRTRELRVYSLTNGNHLQVPALELPLELWQWIGLALGTVLLVVEIIVDRLGDLHDRWFGAHLALSVRHCSP